MIRWGRHCLLLEKINSLQSEDMEACLRRADACRKRVLAPETRWVRWGRHCSEHWPCWGPGNELLKTLIPNCPYGNLRWKLKKLKKNKIWVFHPLHCLILLWSNFADLGVHFFGVLGVSIIYSQYKEVEIGNLFRHLIE